MARSREARFHPNCRELEVAHQVIVERRMQREVAADFGLTQARVAQICKAVRSWVDAQLVKTPMNDPALRLHVSILARRMQLARAYRPYLAFFGGVEGTAMWCWLMLASEDGLLSEKQAAMLPPDDFLRSAARMAEELGDLQELIDRGPLRDVQDRLPESLLGPVSAEKEAVAREAAEREQAAKTQVMSLAARVCQEGRILEEWGLGGHKANMESRAFSALEAAQSAC